MRGTARHGEGDPIAISIRARGVTAVAVSSRSMLCAFATGSWPGFKASVNGSISTLLTTS